MFWKSAMRKCNSFRCIIQLTRETADFGKGHVLSHLQMRRRNIGSKHGFGLSFNPKDPKNFRVTCILWKTWHPSPARLCRPSPLTQGDLKQDLTFPLLLQQNKFTFGFRFPNQNQTRNCWQNYVDFHRCQKLKVRSLRKLFTAS